MSKPRAAFESALIAQRVVARVMCAKADLSDQELSAMHILTMFKPVARKRELEDVGVDYTSEDPTIKSLITKKYVKLQGKSITPDRDKIKAELKNHEAPEKYKKFLTNYTMSFDKGE